MVQFIQLTPDELVQIIVTEILKTLNKREMQQDSQGQEFYTREQASKILDVSYATLHSWQKKGLLVPTKLGKRVYYPKQLIDSKINKKL